MDMAEIKKLSTEYGLFLATVMVVFVIVLLVTLAARGSWEKGLERQVERVFERAFPSEYIAGARVPVESAFSTSAAVYSLVPASASAATETGDTYGVVVRVPSLYGFVPAVFKYVPGFPAEFVGIAGSPVRTAKEEAVVSNLRNSNQIRRWLSRIPLIVPAAGAPDSGEGDAE